MKKILLIGILLFFFAIHTVHGKTTTLTMIPENDIYYAMYNQDFYRSYPFYHYYQNGKKVYCIEPDQIVRASEYEEVSSFDGYSKEQLDRIIKISYFGYDYPGHQTLSYELATQALIWEELKGATVRWHTERYSYGFEIDVSAERNEILRLIRQYETKPNLSDNSISGFIGDHVLLTDENHVLEEYEVVSFDGGLAYIENENLKVQLGNTVGKYKIVLKRKNYDSQTYFYLASNSQTMMKGRISEEYLEIPVQIDSAIVTIHKLGHMLDGNVKFLPGVSFELRLEKTLYYQDGTIWYAKDDLLGIYETGEDGSFSIAVPYGEYYLVETKTQKGFQLDSNFFYFKVTKDQEDFTIENQESYGSLKILKKDKSSLKSLSGVSFQLTSMERGTVFEGATNEFGELLFERLPLGTYQLVETQPLSNYVSSNDPILVSIDREKEIELSLFNEKIPEIPDTASYDFSVLLVGVGLFVSKFLYG